MVDPNAPSLAICFGGPRGTVHLLAHEMDEVPIIFETGMKNRACKWNPNGQVPRAAVCVYGIRWMCVYDVRRVCVYGVRRLGVCGGTAVEVV